MYEYVKLIDNMLSFYNRGDIMSYIKEAQSILNPNMGYRFYIHDFGNKFCITVKFLKEENKRDTFWLKSESLDEHLNNDDVLNKYFGILKDIKLTYNGVLKDKDDMLIIKCPDSRNANVNVWAKSSVLQDFSLCGIRVN